MAGIGKQLRGSGIARINKADGGEVESENDINPYFTIKKVYQKIKDFLPDYSDEDRQKIKDMGIGQPTPLNPDVKKLFKKIKSSLGYKKGGSVKTGLYANINKRKKLGISRTKTKSTISAKSYANMKAGFPKKK